MISHLHIKKTVIISFYRVPVSCSSQFLYLILVRLPFWTFHLGFRVDFELRLLHCTQKICTHTLHFLLPWERIECLIFAVRPCALGQDVRLIRDSAAILSRTSLYLFVSYLLKLPPSRSAPIKKWGIHMKYRCRPVYYQNLAVLGISLRALQMFAMDEWKSPFI